MRPRISIRGSVRPSVGPLVSRYFQIAEIDKSDKYDKSTTWKSYKSDRILQIWQISLCNSILLPHFRRIFVRTNLLFFISTFSFPYITGTRLPCTQDLPNKSSACYHWTSEAEYRYHKFLVDHFLVAGSQLMLVTLPSEIISKAVSFLGY